MSGARALVRACGVTALALASCGAGASAQEEVARTLGGWTVECRRTEAGGRACELRNDEGGKPALAQTRLLAFTLHDGRNEAEGLVRIADLELPPRLEVRLTFGAEVVTLDGVGRHGRLAARFAMPTHELPTLAAADAVTIRFADQQGAAHEVAIATQGLADALALAEDFL